MEKRGEKIVGSRYRRQFCTYCGEPVRSLKDWAICDDCNSRNHGQGECRPEHQAKIMKRIAREE